MTVARVLFTRMGKIKKPKAVKKERPKPLYQQIEESDYAKPTGREKQRIRADVEDEVSYLLG